MTSACYQASVDGQNKAPVANPAATPATGPAPLTVAFASAATDTDGTIASYRWAFGDGATSSESDPTHVYAAQGSFTATLDVADDAGASTRAVVGVVVTDPDNRRPTAGASATPNSGDAPLLVAFTGTGTDSDGTIVSYAWTFGDGGTSPLQNPTHTYLLPGSYTATLTVADNGGATDSSNENITVGIVENQPPIANAGLDQLNRDPGVAIALNGAASSDPDGSIVTYQWSKTSGPTVTLSGASTATPSVVAPERTTATYTFTLTVKDNGTPQLSSQDSVTVTTRVTYLNTTKALIDARGFDDGIAVGCTGCHTTGGESPPLLTYAQVFSNRAAVRSEIKGGGDMRKYLLQFEPEIITSWIDNGAPERN